MPDHRVGFHPVGAPQLGQRQLHADQDRLDAVDPFDRLATGQHLLQRKPDLLNEYRLQLGHRRRECRLIGQQLPAHACPLRALARIHEHRARPARPLVRATTPAPTAPAASARSPATACSRSRAHTVANFCMPGPVVIDGVGDIGQRHLGPGAVHPVRQHPAVDATRSGVLPDTTNVVTAPVRPAAGGRRRIRRPAPAPHAHSCHRSRTTTPPPAAVPSPASHVGRNDFQTAAASNGMCGFGVWKFRFGGMWPCCTASTALMNPAIPAAASR